MGIKTISMKSTPFTDKHIALGAKMAEFAGYNMPISYTGINESKADILDTYFRDKELFKVVFRTQVTGTIWPIRQKQPSEMR